MGSTIGHSIKGKILIYISMFFLLYPDISFGKDNFFTGKPFSIWLCFIFIIINVDKLLFLNFKKQELIFLFCYTMSLLLGIWLKNGDNGIRRNINGYIGFFATYFAIRIYAHKSSKEQIYKLLKGMYFAYVIVLFIGLLQAVYIYLGHSAVLESFFKTILSRGYTYFVDIDLGGRVDFTFSEPSLVGLYFYCFFMPTHWLCKKYSLLKKKTLDSVLLLAVSLNILTLSTRLLFDTVVFFLILQMFKTHKLGVSRKKFIKTVFIGMAGISALIVIVAFVIPREIVSNYVSRFTNVFDSISFDSFQGDQSSTVRLVLASTAIKGFLDNPVFGVGVGGFVRALECYVVLPVNNVLARNELIQIIGNPESTSYSFYFTTMCEGGAFGIISIITVIQTLLKKRMKELRILSWIVIYMFIQVELFGSLPIALWLAVMNSRSILAAT